MNFAPFLSGVHPLYQWKRSSKIVTPVKQILTRLPGGEIEVAVTWFAPFAKHIRTVYRFGAGGAVSVSHAAAGVLLPVLKIGLRAGISKSLENVTWYGRGPHESYRDRLTGAKIGRYAMKSPNSSTAIYGRRKTATAPAHAASDSPTKRERESELTPLSAAALISPPGIIRRRKSTRRNICTN